MSACYLSNTMMPIVVDPITSLESQLFFKLTVTRPLQVLVDSVSKQLFTLDLNMAIELSSESTPLIIQFKEVPANVQILLIVRTYVVATVSLIRPADP
jgi:hypothetical protein